MRRLLLICWYGSLAACKSSGPVGSDLKVVGAEATAAGRFSAVVKVGSCSAVRISEATLLTAKHCVSENGWQEGKAIDLVLKYQHSEEQRISVTLTAVAEHSAEDAALLRVSAFEAPIAIAAIHRSGPGQRAIITGYGCTDLYIGGGRSFPGRGLGYLQSAQVDLWRSKIPSYNFEKYVYVKGLGEAVLGDTKVLGPSLCPGDSGGGLWAMTDREEPRLLGINSSIHLYTLISKFVRIDPGADNDIFEWIQEGLAAEE